MKIAIICGSLQPGHDGVGDYTRRLAGELIRLGNEVIAIALNDRHLKAITNETQNADGNNLPVLRIPAAVAEQKRYSLLETHLLNFKPEWISLQFVPYSFHIKGVPFKLFSKLAALKIEAKWHVLFHEVWLDKTERFSQKIVKLLQKAAIYGGLKILKPNVVNTTINYNQQRLNAIGASSSVLGLFGNISPGTGASAVPNGIVHGAANMLYFGGPPRSEYLNQVITGLVAFCESSVKPVNVILVSGNSPAKDVFKNILIEKLSLYGGQVRDMGFLETPELSNLLNNCSVGIVRSEAYFLGKSGSAVAMLEHGLPIWLPKWTDQSPVDYGFRKHLIHASLKEAGNQDHENYSGLLPSIAQQFIIQLVNN
ncbi:glycosyltransferase [Mucilaginibacter terrae]|uniref:glycosyltransferase n=1 Tax=Mucilaginibacter terrae TaxID=1955052 RepID=UPI003643A201